MQQKLYGAFGATLFLTLLLAVFSIRSLGSVHAEAEKAYSHGTRPILVIGKADSALVDMQRLGLRGILKAGDPAEQAKIDADLKKDAAVIGDSLKALEADSTGDEKAMLTTLVTQYDTYLAARDKVRGFSRSGDAKAAATANNDALDAYKVVATGFDKLTDNANAEAKRVDEKIASTYSSSRTLSLVLAVLALVVGALVAWSLVKGIRRIVTEVLDRLQMLQDHCTTDLRTGLEKMASGDLTFAVTPVTPLIENIPADELGKVAEAVNGVRNRTVASVEAYNATRESLVGLIGRVQEASTTLSATSQQMASTSDEAGRAVGEIAHAVSDVASGAERQVRMVEEARVSAEETGSAAREAREVAEEGVMAAQQASAAMESVRKSTTSVTDAIRGLAEKSEAIGGIVETITGIASQTNLLALNAAIEAARAGEQGRGFAVVAEEVRKLAEESQGAATKIADLIEEIQAETQRTVGVVEDGAKRTEDGVEVVEQARVAFERIGSQVEEMGGRIQQVVTATAEVAAVAEQTSASTQQVSASTEETSASAQQIAASAQDLATSATELQELVDHFKLAGAA
ncbi:MAG: methyl-accepting chemotaxis protein [Gaiellales bacterium]